MGTESTTIDETARELSDDADEINHIICCRSSWETAFCGISTEGHALNFTSMFLCAMCVEEVNRLSGGQFTFGICPVDGTACPDEGELSARVSWEIS